MAHVTTQSATKIYKMNRNYATQVINIKVHEGGYLEFIPDFVIPYQNACMHAGVPAVNIRKY